jgi:EAL domain-containing protein (putative c-di-GMP-specific phosphodiesterase class I)
VNLSVTQFVQTDLVEKIRRLLEEFAMPPRTLKLEITESVMIADPEEAVELLPQIKALGVQLAIDDFGTGYSSLSYLKRFPRDTLKIDRRFTNGLGSGEESTEIINQSCRWPITSTST